MQLAITDELDGHYLASYSDIFMYTVPSCEKIYIDNTETEMLMW